MTTEVMWTSTDSYTRHVRSHRLRRVMDEIKNDYETKAKTATPENDTAHFVLIHPSETTAQLAETARCDPNFRRVCTAIESGVDMLTMYARSVRQAMGTAASSKLVDATMQKFADSGVLGELQKLATQVIENGETFSWVVLHRPSPTSVPVVPRDYVIVYVDVLDKWVVRDMDNNQLELHFISALASNLMPRSTVSDMVGQCQRLNSIREHFLSACHFACHPLYLLSERTADGSSGARRGDVLDPKLVNQARVNEQLESMIRTSVANSTQKSSASVSHSLSSYVSELGACHVNDTRQRRQLERDVCDLNERLAHLDDGAVADLTPRKWTVPADKEVSSSHLAVSLPDILAHERRHDAVWSAVSFGCRDTDTSTKRADRGATPKAGMEEVAFLRKKQRSYQVLLICNILRKWLAVTGILLAVPMLQTSTEDIEAQSGFDSFSQDRQQSVWMGQ